MIVDDEPYNIDSLKVVVQCATFDMPNFDLKQRLDTACNGLDALEQVKKSYSNGQTYKLILMDCNMPKMDGYEAASEIRKHISSLQEEQPFIVAITGHVEEHYR